MKYLKQINYKRSFIIIISFFLLISTIQIYKDSYNYKYKNEKICRYNNIINANNKICYGNVKGGELPPYWLGNHIWNINKENKRIDFTCKDCKIINTIGCFNINNGYINPNINSIQNSIVSIYFLQFNLLKYFKII
jgi:hypothetical protein